MIQFDEKELSRRIDEVLFYVWDPIGVSDEPYARWEYQSYVPSIRLLVENSDSIRPISSHLKDIVQENMGLAPNTKQCDYAAELMLKHKQAIIDGCA